MKNHRFEKEDIVYDDALDRALLSEGDDVFRSFRIYKYGDDFIYYEVIWDYMSETENESLLYSFNVYNPDIFKN